jgi:hypothetical protein
MSADDQDRLTFGEGPLGGPLDDPDADADLADAPKKRNRAFVYVAVAMAGLVLLGGLALVAALTLWLPAQREAQMVAATNTAQAIARIEAAYTATPAPTATPVPPTSTPRPTATPQPEPTPTSTLVVKSGSADLATNTPTSAVTEAGGGGSGTTPAAGLGTAGLAAIAVGLTGLLVAARKLRG